VGAGGVLQGSDGEFDGLFSEVDHALWVDLFHMLLVLGVVGANINMGGPFLAALERELESTHEIFKAEDGMWLVPDDALAEVQAMFLEVRRVVAEVGVVDVVAGERGPQLGGMVFAWGCERLPAHGGPLTPAL